MLQVIPSHIFMCTAVRYGMMSSNSRINVESLFIPICTELCVSIYSYNSRCSCVCVCVRQSHPSVTNMTSANISVTEPHRGQNFSMQIDRIMDHSKPRPKPSAFAEREARGTSVISQICKYLTNRSKTYAEHEARGPIVIS